MKGIFIVFLLFLTATSANSQCIVLKIDLNDCMVCRSKMLKVNPEVTGVPAYVLFPEASRADSVDLDFVGRFSVSNIEMRFNDNWYQQLDCEKSRSCAWGVDKFGVFTYLGAVVDLDSFSLSTFLTANKPNLEPLKSLKVAYLDSLQFKFDEELAVLHITNRFTQKTKAVIRSSNFNLSLITDKLSGLKKQQFDKYGRYINTEMAAFVAKFQNFRILNDSTVVMCYMYHNTPDSISGNITDEFAFIEYTLEGELRNVYLADIPSNMIMYIPDFIASGQELYVLFWALDSNGSSEPENWESVNYIARLILKDGKYVLDAPVPYNIPWYYRKRKMYDYLSLGFSSYPYVSSYLGNEIYDLKSNKKIHIISDTLFRKYADAISDPASFDPALEKFHCYGIDYDKKKNELIVAYGFENKLLINAYTSSLDLISTTTVKLNFILDESFLWATVYPEINSLEISFRKKDKRRKYSLPLDLFR